MLITAPVLQNWADELGKHPTWTEETQLIGTQPRLEVIIYHPSGDGPYCPVPCVLVHGAAHSAACFQLWGPSLAQMGITTYALSLRGHGNSMMPTNQQIEQATLADYVADIHSFYEALSLDSAQAVLVGHSMSGLVVQYFARKYPVAGLVLLCSVLLPHAFNAMNSIGSVIGWGNYLAALRTNAKEMFNSPLRVRQALLEADADEEQVQFVLNHLYVESRIALYPVIFAALRRLSPFPLPRLRTRRVLLLGGQMDRCFKPKHVLASAQRLSRRYLTQLSLIPDGPHDLMLAKKFARTEGMWTLAQFCYGSASITAS